MFLRDIQAKTGMVGNYVMIDTINVGPPGGGIVDTIAPTNILTWLGHFVVDDIVLP